MELKFKKILVNNERKLKLIKITGVNHHIPSGYEKAEERITFVNIPSTGLLINYHYKKDDKIIYVNRIITMNKLYDEDEIRKLMRIVGKASHNYRRLKNEEKNKNWIGEQVYNSDNNCFTR
jgi:hypothetical protein